jgi:hypothetical protein
MAPARTIIHRALRGGAFCACLLGAAAAAAGPPEPSVVQRASDEFDRAMAHWERGDKYLALQGFREAHALVPSDATLWNVIVVEHEIGLWADAHRDLATYLAKFEARITPDRLREAVDMRRELEQKLARLRVVVDALGVTVWVDGAKTGTDVWVAPGEHTVRAEAPDRKPAEKKVAFESGKQQVVELRLPVLPPGPDPVQMNLGFAVICVGAAGLFAGGALTVNATNPDVEDNESFMTAAPALVALSAIAVGFGVNRVLAAGRLRQSPVAPPPKGPTVSAAPAPGGGFLRLTF